MQQRQWRRAAAAALFYFAVAASGAGGCARSPAAAPTPPDAAATVRFTERAHAAGLRYRWVIEGPRPLNILQTIGNGCAFLDYDGDGNLDVLLVGPKPALFQGDGKGRFADVSARTGVGRLSGHFLGCAVGDADNDGFPDVYLSGFREAKLLHNRKGKAFRDVSAAWGVARQPWGASAAFGDVDGDGSLDLYATAYVRFRPDSHLALCNIRSDTGETILGSCPPTVYPPLRGTLYRNRAGKRFEDVTRAWGAGAHTGNGLGVAFADYEGDGRAGFAVANDMVESDLFRNLGGRRVKNVGAASGVARTGSGDVYAGMGLDWGDYDNDGRLDLAMTAFENQTKPLYHNEGGGVFRDDSRRAGLTNTALFAEIPFGCKFADFDNDGNLDLVYASGHVQDQIGRVAPRQTYRQRVRLFAGDGRGRFTDIGVASGVAALPPIVGRGLATGDYDNDGRVDLLVVDAEGTPLLLHNEGGAVSDRRRWLGLRLVGTRANRDGYGAVVTVSAGGREWVRHCHADGSYLSSSDARVHFGLGDAARVDRLTVRWPGGRAERFAAPPLDRYSVLKEGAGVTVP